MALQGQLESQKAQPGLPTTHPCCCGIPWSGPYSWPNTNTSLRRLPGICSGACGCFQLPCVWRRLGVSADRGTIAIFFYLFLYFKGYARISCSGIGNTHRLHAPLPETTNVTALPWGAPTGLRSSGAYQQSQNESSHVVEVVFLGPSAVCRLLWPQKAGLLCIRTTP